jgi:DNA-binding FadR family transcriptional regulator
MAGILDISNGRSPKVGRISDEGIAQFFDHALTTNQATIAQVLDLRATVEVRAAELAATNREAKHVTSLQKDVSIMHAARNDRDRFIDADARFHQTIGQATGNPLFELIGGALRGSLQASIRAGLENRTRRRELDQIIGTHKRIADAISDRDPVQAKEYMIIHFQEAFRSFSLAHKV